MTTVQKMLDMFESKDSISSVSADFPFKIDCVIAWCRDDEHHRRERVKRMGIAGDYQVSRFRDNEELRFCLRSIFFNLPWVNKIYVVCADYQYPSEYILKEDEDLIRVVHHSEFIPPEYLPTFNSQTIEAFLHRIPSLEEAFIYFNDDMFVGRGLRPNYFFTEKGVPRYNLENTFVPDKRHKRTRPLTMHAHAWINNTTILNIIFGNTGKRNYPSHVAVPMLRSSFEKAWENPVCRTFLESTARSPFRRKSNIYLVGFLVYFNIYTMSAERRPHAGVLFHDIEENDDVDGLMKYIIFSRPFLFCLNDGGGNARPERSSVRKWMFRMFPIPLPSEPPQYRKSVCLLRS
jgi:hypothetical protein